MNCLKIDEPVKITRHRIGNSDKGRYELCATADPKGNNEITIFVNNGPFEQIPDDGGAIIKIKRITQIKAGMRPAKDNSGKWFPSMTCEADIEFVGMEINGDDWAVGDADGSLPWESGPNIPTWDRGGAAPFQTWDGGLPD